MIVERVNRLLIKGAIRVACNALSPGRPMARHFPNWLKAYLQFMDHTEAPLEFHFWTGVSTIASVLRRRVWKDELLFKWTPNFYIVLVAPAGVVTKSTTLGVGRKLINDIADKQKLYFGPDSMTWHGLAEDFKRAVAYHTYQDPKGNDQKVLMSPLTCSVSELGTFLRPDDSSLISFLTDVWDGKEHAFRHTTKSSGEIVIENAWLNIISATTPTWLQSNFPPNLIAEGIGSRILFIFADQKRRLIAYPSQVKRPIDYYTMESKLREDLIEMCKMIGEYQLTPEAYKWGTAWHDNHNSKSDPLMSSGRYGGYLARKQTHLHKIAMVLAAAKRDQLIITEEDLKEAEQILQDAERSMIKVFENMGIVDEAKHIAELVNFVKGYGWITVRDLYRCCWNIMSEKDFKSGVRIAIEGDLIEWAKRNNITGLSPNSKKRTIN